MMIVRTIRLKYILSIFVAIQIFVGLLCLYQITTISGHNDATFRNKDEKKSEKIRNIREFHPKEDDSLASGYTVDVTSQTKSMLPECPIPPPHLRGKVKVDLNPYNMEQIESSYYYLQNGGRYQPRECIARNKVAIIIPYRDRKKHLVVLMNNLHSFLQRQQLDYGIYVVEVAPMSDFNRALSLNIGFTEAARDYDYECFIFHDVDLIPENDHNMYTCRDGPRHMSVAVEKLKYKLPYDDIFGGVVAMRKEHFEAVNGFSNKFFGWGGEDDNMFRRIKMANLTVSRYSPTIARYRSLSHKKDPGINEDRFYLLRNTNHTWKSDGLNSLKYRLIKTERHKLFTYILVDIDPMDPAYYTDKKKIVEESLRRMREDFNKTPIETVDRNASESSQTKGINPSSLALILQLKADKQDPPRVYNRYKPSKGKNTQKSIGELTEKGSLKNTSFPYDDRENGEESDMENKITIETDVRQDGDEFVTNDPDDW